nr:MAG TPA: adenylate kinase [Caudoviricetes sp.]
MKSEKSMCSRCYWIFHSSFFSFHLNSCPLCVAVYQ